jgi:hypothetical protein
LPFIESLRQVIGKGDAAIVADDGLLMVPQRREVGGEGGFIPSVKYIRRCEATIFHGGTCPSRLP